MSANPASILLGAQAGAFALPVCDHYSGVEARMRKSLALQAELGPVFDVTLDCEDGAPVGGEVEHAQLIAQLIGSEANRFGRVGARIAGTWSAAQPTASAIMSSMPSAFQAPISEVTRPPSPSSTCPSSRSARSAPRRGRWRPRAT